MKRTVTAAALLVVTSFLASCSKSTDGTTGTLAFDQASYRATSGSTQSLLLTLSGNSDPSGVTVAIASSSSAVVVPVTTQCVLSDGSAATTSCKVQVKGLAAGSATITASAPGVAGASASVTVSSTPVPGTLAFVPPSGSVVVGSTQQVVLALVGSSGVAGVPVAIVSSNTAVATVSPSQCTLSTAVPTCPVTIGGVAAGTATLTASATAYANATSAVTATSSGPIPGTLSFAGNVHVPVNGTQTGTLQLVGSSGVASFNATLSATNALATVSPTTCPLSSAIPVCHFTIAGVAEGSDPITASASGYTPTGMVAKVGGSPSPGTLHFSQDSEPVTVGATTTVDLFLSGGSGVVNLPVTLTASANVSISRSSCSLSSGGSCTITITGIAQGSAAVTASASGYTDAVNSVTVNAGGTVNYGTLSFVPANVPVLPGGSNVTTLTMTGSSNVTGLAVDLTLAPQGVATLSRPTCSLSTASPTCSVTVTAVAGVTTGSATLTTPAGGPGGQASASVSVSPSAPPTLVYSVPTLVLSNAQVGAMTPTLTMTNAPVTPVMVNFTINAPAGTPAYVAISPGFFAFSAQNPTATLNINNTAVGNPPSGPFVFSATPADTSIPPANLNVYVAPVSGVPRTLTVLNHCPFPVFAGVSGGAVFGATPGTDPTQCPPGSTYFASGSPVTYQCMWNNPTPVNNNDPANPTGYALLARTGSVQFVIPANSLTNVPGRTDVWSGGVMARVGCDSNGNCSVGSCNGGQSSGQGCAIGVGFDTPQTVAEFTLLQGGVDAYDVQLINGVTVPTTMKPSDGVTPSTTYPYTNGEAGSTVTQVGTQVNWNGQPVTLNPATWTFDPGSTDTLTSSTDYYNFVTGAATASDTCGLPGMGPCPTGQVCGYAQNSFDNKLGTPTYTLTCGTRVGYLTADAIWKGNPDHTPGTNTAPFDFYSVQDDVAQSSTTPYPNSMGHHLWKFFDCPNPPLQSGYHQATTSPPTPAVTYPVACGCTNWDGVATPSTGCLGTGVQTYTPTTPGIGFNSAWLDYVLPRIAWLKKGCPTCYAYQFDDPSSSFQALVPAGTTNAANSTNYTITFCPGGRAISPN